MLTKNINNKKSFKYNQIPQKKKMQLHKKIFLTLAASLLFTVNYGNISCFAVITTHDAEAFQRSVIGDDPTNPNDAPIVIGNIQIEVLRKAIQRVHRAVAAVPMGENDVAKIDNVMLILGNMIFEDPGVFTEFGDRQAARIVTDTLLKMYQNDRTNTFDDVGNLNANIAVAAGRNYDEANHNNRIRDAISAILRSVYRYFGREAEYQVAVVGHDTFNDFLLANARLAEYTRSLLPGVTAQHQELQAAKDELERNLQNEMRQLEERRNVLERENQVLKAKNKELEEKDPEKLDPETQDKIKQNNEKLKKNEEELKKVEEERKKNQQIADQKIAPEVTQPQKNQGKVTDTVAPQELQTETITNVMSSITTDIAFKRMNINLPDTRTLDTKTSEDENEPVAAGSRTVDALIAPQSWDIWASAHMGNIRQDAANGVSANSQTGFYGGSIGIDKVFANNTIFGLALSGGESNTEYTSQISTVTTANADWKSNYYQADIYAHHNFTDRLFVQLIGGIGTYGDGTTIGNMFDFSSEKFTSGCHGNATIGYSIFGGEDSNFAITPKLGVAYYHLNIPDSIFAKTDSSKNDSSTLNNSSKFTTLDRIDGIASVNIKMFNLSSTSSGNIKIIPEITAAIKWRFSDNAEGTNANNIKLPVVKSTNSDDLSANVLAAPEQLFTLGGALTAVTNNNLSVSINGSVDFAPQYLATVGSISIKLSL